MVSKAPPNFNFDVDDIVSQSSALPSVLMQVACIAPSNYIFSEPPDFLVEDISLIYKNEKLCNAEDNKTEESSTVQNSHSNKAAKFSSESENSSDYFLPVKREGESVKAPTQRDFSSEFNVSAAQEGRSIEGTGGAAPKKRREDVSATPERVEHRVNLTAILQYSNASPFRDKTMRGFSCLYCAKAFPNIDELREHTAQQKEKNKINKMIDYKLSYNPIKVDITNLRCTVCDLPLKDLNELKDHIVTVHNKVIHKHIKDIILPFRLGDGSNFTCVLCSVVHISFKNLYHHMSSHYRNYCCNKCGVGCITIAALRKHHKTHAQGVFTCDYCEKTYGSLTKKRNHEKGVHEGGWLRNKCPHCPEVFVSYYDRSEHLVKVHNQTPILYPCNACNKIYKKKFELNRHIKHHHLQQKNFVCDKCNAMFFSKRGLVDHIARHEGAEMFSCDICGKSFSRLRTLKEHLRMHENDTRYQCKVCKRTFMQKGGLKNHVRLHQDNLDIFKEFDDVKHLIDNRELTLKQIAAENKKKELAQKQQGLFM
ncbi:zinc finger protein 271-like [Bombyx mandarina]|uniref:Zinc finger protein 271-like n=1 Tax=Bombyx mandarina TaxID=7092 RepID=A0A6J2JT83_BOMMA|nr:zinc finger protein 271-like [Bombyx mandarina]